MVKKKPEKPAGLVLKKRESGKLIKTDYMQNLRDFRAPRHPVEDLLFPPADLPETEFVPAISNQADSTGHSIKSVLDTQENNTGHSVLENLSAQEINTGHPVVKTLDTQPEKVGVSSIEKTGHSIPKKLDTQASPILGTQENKTGHPVNKNLSAQTPSNENWTPSNEKILGTQAPSNETIGHSRNDHWRKWDKSRSTVRVNLHIDKEIDRKVRQYCMIDANPRIELKEFYERAAMDLLTKLDTQEQGSLGAQTPYDDRRLMILSKSRSLLINLYLAYNSFFNPKTKWTVKDDEAAFKYNDVDIRLIELGFIQTHFNRAFKPGKINSFSYYENQIEEIMEIQHSEETIEMMIKMNRASWKKATKVELDLSFLEATEKK